LQFVTPNVSAAEDLKDENAAGAAQLRRHADKLRLEKRVFLLQTAESVNLLTVGAANDGY